MRVLSLISYYLPGCRAGGPLRTLANMVARLGDEFEWSIITSDRDLGSRTPYADTPIETWHRVGRANVMYIPQRRQTPRLLADHLRRARPDVLYLNSPFNARLSLPALALRRLSPTFRPPTIIAPRGVFSPAAMARRRFKKCLSLLAAQRAGFFRDVLWQASCQHEADDIRRLLGNVPICLAPDLTEQARPCDVARRVPKRPGRLKLVHLARVAPIKNLLACLRIIDRVEAPIELDIWGPLEDTAYWRQCQAQIARLSRKAAVRHAGVVPHHRVAETLAGYDGLLLPTQSENFGHAIVEALAAGCPPIISDRTPWRGLAQHHAGWDLPLDDEAAFCRVLTHLAAMDESEHLALRRSAQTHGLAIMHNADDLERNRQMLLAAAGDSRLRAPQQAA